MRLQKLIPIFFACLTLAWGCQSNSGETAHEHNHDHETNEAHDHEAEGHDHEAEGHDHEGEAHASGEIVLEPEVAQSFGVKTAVIEPGTFHQVVKATGQILNLQSQNGVVAAPKAGTVHLTRSAEPGNKVGAGTVLATIDSRNMSGGSPDAAAKATLTQAEREYARIKGLYDDRLATVAELTAAEAALESARAQYSPRAVSGTATSPIAGIVTSVDVAEGQFVEVGQPIATVSSATALQLRIDVPQKDFSSIGNLTNAIIRLPYLSEALDLSSIGGKRVSGAALPTQGTAGAYIPVYFQISNDGSLVPGSTFSAYLTGADRPGVITVPTGALIEQQGDYFVFEKIDEHGYRKLRVIPGESDGKLVEIVSGIAPGAEIVTEGATTVRLAEASAVIPKGHSHNH